MLSIIYSLDTGVWVLLIVLCLVFGLIFGLVAGYFVRVKSHEKSFAKTKQEAEKIIAMAETEAEKRKRSALYEAKQEIAELRNTDLFKNL